MSSYTREFSTFELELILVALRNFPMDDDMLTNLGNPAETLDDLRNYVREGEDAYIHCRHCGMGGNPFKVRNIAKTAERSSK
jgi:hypothetical protein